MRNPRSVVRLFILMIGLFTQTSLFAQISGSGSALSVTPATATIVDPAITVGGVANISGATVQIVANRYGSDVLSYNTTLATSFSITGAFNATTGILRFTGTTSPANWQALLRTVTYQNTTAECGPQSRSVMFVVGSYTYSSYNNHYYEYVSSAGTWAAAKAAAALRSYNGLQGYLATIGSLGENNTLKVLVSADGWFGASDDYLEINAATGTTSYANQAAAEGRWHWVTGPEKGQLFTIGNYVASVSAPVTQAGQFASWAAVEPNNSSGEHYGQFYSTSNGTWNDLPGSYSLPGYIVEYGGLPGDNPQGQNFTRTLTLTSTLAGSVNGGNVTVCSGSNSTVLTSTAAGVGGVTVVRWESSIDNFLTTPVTITNTTGTLTATNLTQTTYYRVVVNGGSCTNAISDVTKITVGTSVPGTVSAVSASICNGSVADLSLFGNIGNVVRWQSSPNNSTWTDIANTTSLYTTPALSTGTHYYRAQVQNPGCGIVNSNSITITVSASSGSVSGSISGASTACGVTNTGILTLSGYTGNILKWQSSIDNGIIWSDIANTTNSYTFNNISVTTKYRALVQNGSCNIVNATPFTVTYSGTANTWYGTTSTNFATASNWTCGVPGAGSNIVISSTAPVMPVLDQNRTLGSIVFENNTNFNLGGYTLTVNGTLTGTSTGTFTGSASSALVFTGNGNAGTVYFNQNTPGTTNLLNGITINRNSVVTETPPSATVCTPVAVNHVSIGVMGIKNVTLGSINNTTVTTGDTYKNYYNTYSTQVNPSTAYTVSVTTGDTYVQYIKIWIDWNNNGVFGDVANEIITTNGGGGINTSYGINFTTPAIGGAITGGAKTMRILSEYTGSYTTATPCAGNYGEYEDYKINLTPLPQSVGQITLGNNLQIGGTLSLTQGLIVTGSNILTMAAGSTTTGAGTTSYVNGLVRKVGNTAYSFPVGNSDYYAPISISAPATSTDHFTASYIRANPLTTYNNSSFGGDINGISATEYWMLDRTGGTSGLAVTLSWNNTRSSAVAAAGGARVAKWDGSAWANGGNTTRSGNSTAGTVTSGFITSFSPFTIGTSSNITLPVTLINFTAKQVDQTAVLNWQTATEINNSHFEIERSIDGNSWEKIGEVKGNGTTNSVSSYQFTDAQPQNGTNYYRLKQIDLDLKSVYSPVKIISFNNNKGLTVYPNPFKETITIDAGKDVLGKIRIVDNAGRVVYEANNKKTRDQLSLGHLVNGVYTIINNGRHYKIIKL